MNQRHDEPLQVEADTAQGVMADNETNMKILQKEEAKKQSIEPEQDLFSVLKQTNMTTEEQREREKNATPLVHQKGVRMKEMPQSLRPRERLMQYGTEALPTYELLAILLGSGQRGENAVQLAMRILNQFDGLFGLKHATYEELTTLPGIGPSKALTILAAIALGERMAQEKGIKNGTITSCEDAGAYFLPRLKDLEQEHVMVLFLNMKNEIVRQKTIFIGSLNTSVAHPREIFKEAIRSAAAHIIVAHNHPSGNPTPSKADLAFTERLVKVGELVGIDIVDHLIIGEDDFVSLREKGWMTN